MRRGWPWLALTLILAAGLLGGPARPASRPATGTAERAPGPAQPNGFFNPTLFYGGLAAASANLPAADTEGRLTGGLVPHHDLAAELLSAFFRRLEDQPPAVIILVGPNHEGTGQAVITGRRGWQTNFGLVEPDITTIEALEAAGLAAVDDEALEGEHAAGVLMPYIKYHVPEARVVPLILRRDMSLPEIRRLATALAERWSDDQFLLASVDFSHYLPRAAAEKKDAETLRAIQASDLDALMRMGPDNLDSPGSLAVLLLAMQAIGADGPHVTGHSNAGEILRDDLIETTSYFTLLFTRQ